MISLKEFGQNIKSKWPTDVASDGRNYSDIPDDEIAQMYVKTHPEYSDHIDELASLGTRISSDVGERMKTIEENKAAADTSSGLDMANKTLQNLGEAAGGVLDVGTEVAKSVDRTITGGAIEKGIESATQWIGNTEPMKALGAKLSELAGKYPETAKDIEAVANIAGLIPVVKGAKMGVETGIGAVKKGAKAAIAKTGVADEAVNKLEADYLQYAGATKSGMNKADKAARVTDLKNAAGTTGKTPQRTLAEARIIPEHTGTKFTTTEQAAKYRESIRPLNEAMDTSVKQLRYSTVPTPVATLEQKALQRVGQMTMPEGDRAALIADIKSEFSLIKEKYGNSLTAEEIQKSKAGYWKGTKFDSTKPFKSDSYYQVAKSLQEGLEEMAATAGHTDVAQLSREIGDRLEAAKFLESLNGQTIKGGRLQKYVFMGIGASLGNTLPAKVLGAIGGEAMAQLLIDVNVSSPMKRLILKHIADTNPAAYDATLKWIAEQQGAQELRLLLPEGAMRMPAGVGESSVKSVPAPKGEPGRTPKGQPGGGQFFKTFKSDIPSEQP